MEGLLFSFSGSEAFMVYTLLCGPMVYTPLPLFSQEDGIHHSFF